MCIGVHYIHSQCRHAKKFDIIQACNQLTSAGCTNLTTAHIITISAPRLCVPCFRQQEGRMDAEYERTRTGLEGEMAKIDESLANGRALSDARARNLRAYRETCEDDIVQAKASRDLSIRLFRQRQGVWGDG